jgi:ABC-type nitrate/sulfonate/bicarbonate transport system substrate-binding protein
LLDAKKELVYPTASVVTRRKTIREDRDTVMRFVRSYVEGIAFLKQNKEFSQKVLAKYLRTSDPEYLEGAYTIFKQDFIAAPYPSQGAGRHLRYRRVQETEIRSTSPRFRRYELCRRVGQERIHQKLYEQR